MRFVRVFIAVALVASLFTSASTSTQGAEPYLELVGALHNHSGYSDGWPGTTPADVLRAWQALRPRLHVGGEHSDNLDIPVTANEGVRR